MQQIVVEKLTKNVIEDHLREVFGLYGQIQEIDMPMNRQCTQYREPLQILSANNPSSQHQQRNRLHHVPRSRRRRESHHSYA
jgi:RNA recognition motif-containing protein